MSACLILFTFAPESRSALHSLDLPRVGSTALGRPLSNTSLASQSSFADPFSERLSEGAQPYPLQLHDVPPH